MSTDDARNLLKEVCVNDFKDKTFGDYIDNRLAGDFACEMSSYVKDLQQKVIQLEADLLASQASEARLRGFISKIDKFVWYRDAKMAQELLSNPPNTDELDAYVQQKLLQSQASEARLREHIEAIWQAYGTVVLNGGTGFARHLPEPIQAAKKALSNPPNTAELDAYVEREIEKRFEVVAWRWKHKNNVFWIYNPDDVFIEKIKLDNDVVIEPLYAKKG